MKPTIIAAALSLFLLPQIASGQSYAAKMNRTGIFRHDPSYRGLEVIYFNSNGASRRKALKAWRASPAHNALLPRIKRITIRGNYAVGRERFLFRLR